ncbi:glycosyl hydrolase family 18 protein [Paenibacillus sp. BK033]|uniref:glycosyl hydrolase family 18 protein n=1 Tax=Paenibacillus sp. BK033 TaxID=2512133 RepID=UPI001FB76299|nr:glycosyl hydrolase family 18 protein [Paenibacillus sp. BK033]
MRRSLWNLPLLLVVSILAGIFAFAPNARAEEGQAVPPAHSGPANLRIAQDENGADLITHNTAKIAWDLIGDETNNNDIDIWNADTDAWMTWGDRSKQEIGGLTPETTYRVYITWYADRPSLEFKSNVIEFTTASDTSEYPEPPLAPPGHLRTTAITDNSITLKWTGSPGANGYDLYVNGAWKQGIWDGSNTVTYTLPEGGNAAGTAYKFEVGAQNMPKVSASSNAVTVTWGGLAAPDGLQAVTATRTTAALGWAETPGATGYDIYANGRLIGSSIENRYVASGLQEGTSYDFKVAAKNALWRSADSSPITVVPGADYNIVTYYTLWSPSSTGRNYHPSDVDVSQITHVNLAFADLCWRGFGSGAAACQNAAVPTQTGYVYDGEIIVGDPSVDLALFEEWAAIRDANPHLKLMISVGGWSWSNNFSNMAGTEETRRAFANSVVKFLRAYKLDGVDIDWEYPVEGGEDDNSRSPLDKENFGRMAQAVREALDAAGSEDGKYYLQTIAAGQGDNFVVHSNLGESSDDLDFINIMTYDYSGSWDTLAHHNSPLYYDKNHPKDYAKRNNVLGGVLAELNGGVPNYKVNIGIPFYGKGWIGCEPGGQYQSCASGTPFGTWENGIFDFTDIEENYLHAEGYEHQWNNEAKVSYLYNADNGVFLTYNDESSMMYIASLARSLDLPGVMSWDISGDRNRTLTTSLAKDLPITGIPDPDALSAPTGLQAASTSSGSITVKWNASEHATAYEVYVDKALAGSTSGTSFHITGLTPDTSYAVEVLAIQEDNGKLANVSAFGNLLTAKTAPVKTTPSEPAKEHEGLITQVAKDGDKLLVSLPSEAALKEIASAASSTFPIIVEGDGKQLEVALPKEITAAIAAKDSNSVIVVRWNSSAFSIPAAALPAGTDIRISVETLDPKLLQQSGIPLVTAPLSFKIEGKQANGTFNEITDFGDYFLSHAFTVKGTEINKAQTAGVVYLPEKNELRPVPVLFTENADGTVTAELKRKGNSVYGLVKTTVSFTDTLTSWAKQDVSQAAYKLLVSVDADGRFNGARSLNRAEVTSLIAKALGILPDYASAGTAFKDVAADSAYAADIAAAKKAGLVNGKGNGLFDPTAAITREETAVIAAKALAYAGVTAQADSSVLNHFADRSKVSGYAEASLALLVERGIMKGVSTHRLAPQTTVTKEQATVLVMKMLRSAGLSN